MLEVDGKILQTFGDRPKGSKRASPMDTWKKGIQVDGSSSAKTLQKLTGQV